MRAVLHQPAFQSLEAAWRGLRRFVDSVDLGEQLTLHVADVGKEELDADLASCEGDLSDSGTYRLVGESSRRGAEAGNWTLLVGLYRFGATERDLRLMERLAAVAATLHTPLLADAEPSLLGSRGLPADPDPRNWSIADDPVAARWQALRASPSARWLGLAIPRILQRLPYGARTEPIESFAFEEMAGDGGHEDYLWGSAALACAQAMGSAAVDGLDGLPSCGALELDDLPAHTRRINGETVLQPCAEVLLPLGTGEVVSRHGIIPMLSYSGRNAVRVMSVQSIADPPGALAGAVDGLLGVTEDRSP
jgi:type VI secretion system protein ImpC